MLSGDTLIQCGGCGYIASEYEFSPDGNPEADLTCPQCKDTDKLFDIAGPMVPVEAHPDTPRLLECGHTDEECDGFCIVLPHKPTE